MTEHQKGIVARWVLHVAVAGAKWDFSAEAGMKEAWAKYHFTQYNMRDHWSWDIEVVCWPQDLEGIKAAPRPNANAPPPLAGAAGAAIGLHLECQLFSKFAIW